MEKGQDLIFTAIVSTKPEIKLEKYKGIEISKIEYNVKDEDITEQLKKMQEQNARLITIEDRKAELGDIATIDFEGFVNGKAFEGGKAEKHELTLGSGSFIPGFEDQVVGMKINEEKEIKVKFPEEYYSKELAGKDATFKVTLHGLKKKELPELDDEFAKDVSEYETLKELKQSIKEDLQKKNKEKEKYEKQDAIMKVLVDNLKVEIPSGMVEFEVENIMKDLEQRMQYQGIKMEQYLKILNKTEEDLKKEYEPQAINSIKSRLILDEIVKAEKLEASEEEIKTKIEEMAKNYGKESNELEKNENIKKYIKESIQTEKVMDFLIENCKETKKEETENKKQTKEKKETKKENAKKEETKKEKK